MTEFDTVFIGAIIALIAVFLTLWLGPIKNTLLQLALAFGSIIFVALLLLLLKNIFGFESGIFGAKKPDNPATEATSTEEDTAPANPGTEINNTETSNDGFVLNNTYYSYDGSTQFPTNGYQHDVVVKFTEIDVTGWEVTISIADGPFGIVLTDSYSGKLEFTISSGKYSIQVSDQIEGKEYVYNNIVEINNDGEYVLDLRNAEKDIH